MAMIQNCSSSDWDVPLSSLFVRSVRGKRRRSSPEVNAMNLIGKLGNDLLVEILIRLPNPRSSCRCKAVCKQWGSVISDPSFNRQFIAHHRSKYQPPALFLPAHDPQSILIFLPVPDRAKLRVFDCFKDLLLCGYGEEFGELERSFLICNPFTKQWIAVPLSPKPPKREYTGSEALLVCQPRSNYNYNLVGDEAESSAGGFIYSEYRFRVVRLLQCGKNLILEVFRSDSGTWRKVVRKNSVKKPWSNVVSWKKRLFCINYDGNSDSRMLLSFDPFRLLMRPNALLVHFSLWDRLCAGRGNLSISQGDMHIIILDVEGVRDASRNTLSVWRLEVEDNVYSWSQKYEMVLKTTSSLSSSLWGNYELDKCSVLCLHPEKPEIVFLNTRRIVSSPLIRGWG